MAMSNRSKVILCALTILGIVFIPFFIYKIDKLSEYNMYPGKVKGIEKVNVYYTGIKRRGGYAVRYIPQVEYYSAKDTSSFTDGTLTIFSYYETGDEISVLERKDDSYKAHIYSLWHYYLLVPELILLLLISFIIFAISKVFILKV